MLIVQIRGAAVTRATAAARVSPRGWFYQAFAPVATMLHVRNAGQISHNEAEYDLLQRAWKGKVEIRSVVFEFLGGDPPLSWHLTAEEKQAIEDPWSSTAMNPCRAAVISFLDSARPDLLCSPCAAP